MTTWNLYGQNIRANADKDWYHETSCDCREDIDYTRADLRNHGYRMIAVRAPADHETIMRTRNVLNMLPENATLAELRRALVRS